MALTTSAQQILQSAQEAGMDHIPPAFWQLIERYRGELVNQAFSILGNLSDAEDAAQETFCEVFRRQDQLQEVESLGAWIRSINRANALDHRRARQRNANKTERKRQEMRGRFSTTGGFSGLILGEELARKIEQLQPKPRAIVSLRFYESLSYEEISARLDMPLSTVYRLFYKASQTLFTALGNHLPSPLQSESQYNAK